MGAKASACVMSISVSFASSSIAMKVTINTGVGVLDERVGFAGFYAQDQWTMKRLTLNGAIRYDQAWSNYGDTCVSADRHGSIR